MNRRKIINALSLASLVIVQAACLSVPQPDSTATTDTRPLYTQAAKTIVAGITETAQLTRSQQTGQETQTHEAVHTAMAQMTQEYLSPTASSPTPAPTVSSIPNVPVEATLTPVPAQSACDRANLIADVSVDQINWFYPGQNFLKTWQFQNVGACTWTPEYMLVMVSGDLRGSIAVPLPDYVRPGQIVDLTVSLVSPVTPGSHTGYWMFRNARGEYFGVGSDGQSPIPLSILVIEPGPGQAYDFIQGYCEAVWRTGAGIIPCEGNLNDVDGHVLVLNSLVLEDGTRPGPAIWAIPNDRSNGWISGSFPSTLIQAGDRFVARVGCLSDSPGCEVMFQVEYETFDGAVETLGRWREAYDGRSTSINVDLTPLAGQFVRFILTITVQNDLPLQSNAVWVMPRIER
jgi:hypothetical protein